MLFVLLVIAAAAIAGLSAIAGLFIYSRVRGAHPPKIAATAPSRKAVGERRATLPAREKDEAARAQAQSAPQPVERPKPSKLVFVIWGAPAPRRLSPPAWLPPRRKSGQRRPAPEVARTREKARRELELRKLDVRVALDLLLYHDVHWNETGDEEPTGVPKTEMDKPPHQRERQVIPRYSSRQSAFLKVVERVNGFKMYGLYLEVLREGEIEAESATQEQGCLAAVEAMRRKKWK